MNASKYDHVVEVKKHAKVPWYKRCLDFSLEEDMDFMQGMYDRQKNFYLCEKGSKIYLVDSDNHENEIANIIEEVYQIGKPILSFDNTCHNVAKASFICESKRPEKMVDAIKEVLNVAGY